MLLNWTADSVCTVGFLRHLEEGSDLNPKLCISVLDFFNKVDEKSLSPVKFSEMNSILV